MKLSKRTNNFFRKILNYSLCSAVYSLVLFQASAMETPKRIISLAPSITESLYELEVEDNLIGVTSYCDHPETAKNKTKIGTIINPNIEKILSLSPDLIIGINDANRKQSIEKLKKLGLEIVILEECENFDDIINNFRRLSKIVGKEIKGEKIVKKAKEKLKELTKDTNNASSINVFWQVNAKPLVTVGRNTFAGDIIKLAGGINIFQDINAKYPRVNCEEVILRNPQVIILVTMGDVTAEQKLLWQKFKRIDAVYNSQIYVVDANSVCRPTISSFIAGMETIKDILDRAKAPVSDKGDNE